MVSGPELKLESSTKLFGRERELKWLSSLRNDTKKRHENHTTVLLHGPAGSGRSSLIPAAQQASSWNEQGWLLATGKYSLLSSSNEPFSALAEALNSLAEQWIFQNNNHNENHDDDEDQSAADVCRFQAFQSLLQENYEVMQSILPKVYSLVATNSSHCSWKEDSQQQQQNPRHSGTGGTNRGSFTVRQDLGTVKCVHASFVRIITCLCQPNPVVLFLDDVQWADEASLNVIHVLATSCYIPGLLLVLSYRDDEDPGDEDTKTTNNTSSSSTSWSQELSNLRSEYVSIPEELSDTDNRSNKPLVTADDTKDANKLHEPSSSDIIPVIYDMHIRDLDLHSVNSMIASIVQRPEAETLSLSKVIHRKTAGNPFFVMQFLRMLRQEDFLHYSVVSFQWEWGDVVKLENNATITSNVADIAARTMQKGCKPSTLVTLKVASCFGKIIPLRVLLEWFEQYYDQSQDGYTCSEALRQVKLEGLYNVLEDAVQLGILIRPLAPTEQQGTRAYMWANDKLQAVAYSLIEEEFRPFLHMKLGKLLWETNQNHPEQEWMVFMAAEQMNRYSQTIRQGKDREALGAEVAALCVEAAKLSLSKSALYPAYDMLMAGAKHLDDEKWSDATYKLSLKLYGTLAELAYQLGKREDASSAAKEVESNAKTLEDKFHGQVVLLKCLTSGTDRNYDAGVERATDILKEYGVRFPSNLLPGQIMMECSKVRRKMPAEKFDSILDLPEMTDPRTKKIMKLLLLHISTYIAMSPRKTKNKIYLSWYAALRALNLSIEYGICAETAFCFTSLGWAYCAQGKLKEADEFGALGLKIVNRFPQTVGSHHAGVMAVVAVGIYSSTRPINKCLDLFLENHHVALRTGSPERATLCVLAYILTYMMVGLPLGPLKLDLIQFEKEARQFNLPVSIMVVFKIYHQFIINLEDPVAGQNPCVLKGQIMDQDEILRNLQGNAHHMTKRDIDTQCLILACIYGEWEMAEKLLGEVEPFIDNDHFVIRASMRRSTAALAAFKLSREKSGIARRRLRSLGKKVLKELRQNLKDGNVNALPLYTMLEAEESQSKERYDTAIRACARLGLLHFEAYMCEAAGDFFLEQNDENWGEFYLAQAFSLYGDWGAKGKVHQLKQKYPRLLKSAAIQERVNNALKGRSRYTSEHADLLKDFNWERLSTSTTSTSSKSKEEDDVAETDGTSESGSNDESVRSCFSLGQVFGLA